MVSIVIPCYNQIHYTYACLQSILEFTKDVTYEVIIADDVSTDATAEIGRFVDGLVICRNQTNQGFLRNCNQAAKAAKGKYIMFLNNDTKVTEGWLSSLVNLIESDDTCLLYTSYVNFYIANEAVLFPQFQDKHDKLACDILGKLFPERRICPIDARAIIIGGGNIHCITQQIPSGIGK